MRRKTASTAASSVWSHAIAVTVGRRFAGWMLRPVAKTLTPAPARAIATPSPTPRLAPVTSAVCPLRLTALFMRDCPCSSVSRLVPVQGMDDAVDHRCQQEPRGRDHDQTAVEGVQTCEQLAVARYRLMDGAHPPKQHRRVQEGVEPGQPLEPDVPQHAGEERQATQADDEQRMHEEAPGEVAGGGRRLAATLVLESVAHERLLRRVSGCRSEERRVGKEGR